MSFPACMSSAEGPQEERSKHKIDDRDTKKRRDGKKLTVDLGEISEGQCLVQSLDLASSSKSQSLVGILSVSDVGSDNSLGEEDSPEDRDPDVGVGWETNGNTDSVRSEVLESLLVSGGTSSGDHSGVRTQSIGSSSLDGLDNVLFRLEIDPLLGTELLHELFLLGSGVNSDYANTPVDITDQQHAHCQGMRLAVSTYMLLAYWTARCPRPPPAPGMTSHSPALTPDSLMACSRICQSDRRLMNRKMDGNYLPCRL